MSPKWLKLPDVVYYGLPERDNFFLIDRGVWHAAGISPGEEPALYGLVLYKEKSQDHPLFQGMVPFPDGAVINLVKTQTRN